MYIQLILKIEYNKLFEYLADMHLGLSFHHVQKWLFFFFFFLIKKILLSGQDNFCLVHVSLIPVLGVVGEQVNTP
jgi:hypothetical protein